jgi:hypothetical protein
MIDPARQYPQPGVADAEIGEALAKADGHAKRATVARTFKERDFHVRMQRKWLGLAAGWRQNHRGQQDKKVPIAKNSACRN